mmetsp:Transcript_13474/g.25762  ORF Transcript_13474/g.25762 Transcript_13474/m.25762 type:complete len:159 (-) Transcript_13474:119-595(-)
MMEKDRKNKPLRNLVHPPPRPTIPAGGAPVKIPHDSDVLSGRGGGVNGHPGNKRYRSLVASVKAEYLSPRTRKIQKSHIAANIVCMIRQQSEPPGRFLKMDTSTGMWHEIGDKSAFRKTGQALRENSSEYRTCWKNMLAEAEAGVTANEVKATMKSGV